MRATRLALGLACLFGSLSSLAAPVGYFRYPSLHDNTLVFTAEGDLWSASADGGPARRLTTHPADETRSALSPDGRWVAFSASYDGPTEAYVMPVAGGQPKRISFENARSYVVGWTPSGEVLYSTQQRSAPNGRRVVVAVNPASLARHALPVAEANDAVLDDTGEWLYFVRFGLEDTSDNARAYRGGAMAQLWRYNLKTEAEAERIGPRDANVKRPMWWQGRLIVVCDRSGRNNLWSLAANGSDAVQLTHHADFDIRGASLGQGRVAYQLGADLHVFDLAGKQDRQVVPQLVSDFDQQRQYWLKKPLNFVANTRFGGNGERVAVTARGHVVLASTGSLRRVDIAPPEGGRLRNAVLSHDGRWVYAINDADGRNEIWRLPADGTPAGKPLTHDGDVYRWSITPSPDGKWLVHTDKKGRAWLLDVATGKNTLIDDAGKAVNQEEYSTIAWSADSRAIALVRPNSARALNQLGLYSLDTGKTQWLTSDKYESDYPAFSPDGHWLYFVSNRNFQVSGEAGPWGDRRMGPAFNARSKVYALALQPGLTFPFLPHDELHPADNDAKDTKDDDEGDDGKKADAKKAEKKENKKLPTIAWNGLADRLYEVPVPPGDYRDLDVDAKRLYLLEHEGDTLKTFAIDDNGPVLETFAAGVQEFALSDDGKKLFYRKTAREGLGELYIVEPAAKAPNELGKSTVRIADWSLPLDPKTEWRAMFEDAWMMHQAYFYDPAMRGVDWQAVRRKYLPLAERVTSRAELDDVLGQMTGEVGSLHSQIDPGDIRKAQDAAATAGLGAVMERVEGGWRVAHIYHTERELPEDRAPLQRPGVDVREGDVITAVNGRPSREVADFSLLLQAQAGQQVLLDVRRNDRARRVVVTPVDSRAEASLRYGDWEQSRLERVEQAGAGKIGYLHLRAMVGDDLNTFVREFYAQYNRDGLIIDVRHNNGGSIDSWIIEKLQRRIWEYWVPPNSAPYSNMQQTFRGHLVVLTDSMTYSDGETFAAGIKALKLAPLIGTRTAGAGVWLSDRNDLADGGMARAAEHPQYLLNGQWLIENAGVTPDIEVDNPPHASFGGQDAQLEAAIGWLQQKLKDAPLPTLKPTAIPPLKAPQ